MAICIDIAPKSALGKKTVVLELIFAHFRACPGLRIWHDKRADVLPLYTDLHAYWGGWRGFPRLSWRSSFLREMRVHPRQVRGSVIKGANAGGGKGVSPTRPAVRVVVRR